jgi:CRP/FNR family cyclic AMP-dependent transcriptional regulator
MLTLLGVGRMAQGGPLKTSDEGVAKKRGVFNAQDFLDAAGVARTIRKFAAKDAIFSQGEPCKDVLYIQKGHVQISVVSKTGKEAVVAMLKPGDFLGEGGLAGQPVRISSAVATTPASLLVIDLKEMIRVLHAEHAFSDRFISYMLKRNIRIEEDLIDQLFNSSEKRLARTLLLLARYGKQDRPQWVLPKVSQETLAGMIGTTRSRVNFFMKKFEKLGFIHHEGGLHINDSLLTVVLHD